VSDSIVWQRLVNDRFVIFVYHDGEEVSVSDPAQNSMEPHRFGQYTVWQSWVDGNWDIMLYDGDTIKNISQQPAHDISPHIQGAHVIWSTTNGEKQIVSVYELTTGLRSTINDEDGGRVENPRFVLVYDTKFDNGDIITKGFDAESGEVIPLAAQAPVVPKDIPDSDQTGETRALIQNKSSSREEVEDLLVPVPNKSSNDNQTSSTTTITSTTSINEMSTDTSFAGETLRIDIAATSTPESIPLLLTEFDVIVEPFSSATTTAHTEGSSTSVTTVE
jgi:hypothetical protein